MDPPSYTGNVPGRPVDPYRVSQFRKYLMELDDWANKTLMWDRSDASSIDLMIQAIMSGAASMSQQQQAQQVQDAQQPSKQSESTDEITIDLG
jgi:outer membrane biogenesis lipoprotein LolB